MYSFKDFLAVSSTGETEQQDLNAKKRHRMVGMWEDAAVKKEFSQSVAAGSGDPIDPNAGEKRMIVGSNESAEDKTKARGDKMSEIDRAREMIRAHHKTLGPDPHSYASLKKAGAVFNKSVKEATDHPFKEGQVVSKTDQGRSRGWKFSRATGAKGREFEHPEHGSVIAHIHKEGPSGVTHYKIHSIRNASGRKVNPVRGTVSHRTFVPLDPGTQD